MDGRMAKMEGKIDAISDDISEMKTNMKDFGVRLTEMEKVKYRIQGMGYVLSGGLFLLVVKVFFFEVYDA